MSTAPARARRRSGAARLDRVFAALSHETRRALIARLGREPTRVTDLAAPFNMSLQAVSKHLRVLEDAGLLRRSVDGRVHRCSLDPGPLHAADEWLAHYRVFWEDTLGALARHVAEKPEREKPE